MTGSSEKGNEGARLHAGFSGPAQAWGRFAGIPVFVATADIQYAASKKILCASRKSMAKIFLTLTRQNLLDGVKNPSTMAR
jgi:hypothetical protein